MKKYNIYGHERGTNKPEVWLTSIRAYSLLEATRKAKYNVDTKNWTITRISLNRIGW
jgi:hypothetical protein